MTPEVPALCTTPSYLTLKPSKMALTLRHHTKISLQCSQLSTLTYSASTNKMQSAQHHTTAGIICPWMLQYTEDSYELQSGVSGRVDVRQCLPYCLSPSQQPGMLCRPQHVGCPVCCNDQSCHCCNLYFSSHESYLTAELMHQPVTAASLAG